MYEFEDIYVKFANIGIYAHTYICIYIYKYTNL